MKDPLIKSREMMVLLILPDRAQPAGAQTQHPSLGSCPGCPGRRSGLGAEELRSLG